jgi:hypothetical protein
MFGEMVMESQERERSNFVPRRLSTKIREAYARLPMDGITTELLVNGGTRDLKGASGTLNIWLADGLVIRDKKTIVTSLRKYWNDFRTFQNFRHQTCMSELSSALLDEIIKTGQSKTNAPFC